MLHKLLDRQVKKFIDPALLEKEEIKAFIESVNNSYHSFERDKQLADHAFGISEYEYALVNERLSEELKTKQDVIKELHRTIKQLDEQAILPEYVREQDFLLDAMQYLNAQIGRRKKTETELQNSKKNLDEFNKRLSTLIANMNIGVLLEDENRDILITNQLFCDLFSIPTSPEQLIGMNCAGSAEQTKHLFKNPDSFIENIEKLLRDQSLVLGDILEMEDGRILLRDYIPIRIDGVYKGHLWNYKDITTELNNKRSLERLSAVARANENGIAFSNKSGELQWINEGFTKLTGFTLNDCLGKEAIAICTGQLTDTHVLENVIEDYRAGKSFNAEVILYRKDGTWFWSRIHGQALLSEEGRSEEYFAMIEDITREREDRKKISEFESRFRLAFEKIGDNVWEHDFTSNKTYFSNTKSHLLGEKMSEFTNNANLWWQRTHPDDRYLLEQNDQKYRKGEIDFHSLEYRIYDKVGSIRWVLDRGVVIETNQFNQPLRIIGTHTDITERKMAEQILQKNEEKYRGIIANMRLGLLEVDLNETILFANQSFCDMSGYRFEELVGRNPRDLFLEEESHTLMNEKNGLRAKGIADAYEIKIRDRFKKQRWWLISGATRYDDKGNPAGSLGIHLDITSQKNLESELINARIQAELSSKSKQHFLANMSHEIRTPMNAVMGMAAELAKTNLQPKQKFYLNTIQSATENLLVIINDILDLSKIEEGKLQIEHIPFELKPMFTRALQVMAHKAEEKGLLLSNSYFDPAIAPVLKGDPYRINQIILNLLSNAVKFTEKGRVDISCLLLDTEDNKQQILFKVLDTGKGMDTTFIKSLFEKFSQEYESNTRMHGGTGLGMSICKNLVELMGGEIKVSSTKNIGTEVVFILNLQKGEIGEVIQKEEVLINKESIFGARILVVDDNEMNRLVATTMLDHYNTVITEACSGFEAIEFLKTQEIDVVLMDIQMPEMSGLEATAIIRNEINKDIPIIALTANAIKGENEKCLQVGMNDYLSKPFEEKDLISIIHRWTHLKPKAAVVTKIEPAAKAELYSLAKLFDIGRGNQEFVNKMLVLFIEQVPPAVQDIKKALASADFDTIHKTAHRIKPIIRNLDISSFYEEIVELETLALEQQKSPRLEALVHQLDEIIGRVCGELKEYLAKPV